MSTLPWPDHLLGLDDWDALPPDPTRRYELSEGVLLVTPRPTALHQRAGFRLAGLLDQQLPGELSALTEAEVVIDEGPPATVRVPDVIVVPTSVADADPARVRACDVRLAVEILSPGTARTDRTTKLFEYADAGIPSYWILDLRPPATVTAHLLVDGDYEIVADGTGPFVLTEPAPVRITVPALVVR